MSVRTLERENSAITNGSLASKDTVLQKARIYAATIDHTLGVVWSVPLSPRSHIGREAVFSESEFVVGTGSLPERRTIAEWTVRDTPLTTYGVQVGSRYLVEQRFQEDDIRFRRRGRIIVGAGLNNVEPEVAFGAYYQNGHPTEQLDNNSPWGLEGIDALFVGFNRLIRTQGVGVDARSTTSRSPVIVVADYKKQQSAAMRAQMKTAGVESWSQLMHQRAAGMAIGTPPFKPLPPAGQEVWAGRCAKDEAKRKQAGIRTVSERGKRPLRAAIF